jgi:hypothetical protein
LRPKLEFRKEISMKRKIVSALLVTAVIFSWSLVDTVGAKETLPSKSHKSCLKCHQYDKEANLFAGKLVGVSRKAKTIQLNIGKHNEVIYFDDATVLENAPSMKKIKKSACLRIRYFKKDGKNYAKKVTVKKGLKVPKEKLASVEEVAALVAMGPEKGKYVLIDSRPPKFFNEGHVPTAVNMLYFKFDKLKDKILPKNEETLQIYYCGGFT